MRHTTFYQIQKRDVNNQTIFSMDRQSYDFNFTLESDSDYTLEDARCHRDELIDEGGSAIPFKGFKRHYDRPLTSDEARLENLVIVQVTVYEDVVL